MLKPSDTFFGWQLAQDPHEQELDLNATNNSGRTPLHWFVSNPRSELDIGVLHFLLEREATVNPVDADGLTPLDHATGLGLDEIAQILLEYGATLGTP